MKGFVTALTLFSVLVFSLFLYNNFMKSSLESFYPYLKEIEASIDDESFEKAITLCNSFQKKLSKSADYLYFVTDRAPIDNALTECARLKSFLSVRDKAESLASVSAIEIMLKTTVEKSIIETAN